MLLPDDDSWHRVTFKLCRAEGTNALCFNVFVDERQASSGDIADVPSMSDPPSITTICFDGTSDVDNIVACDSTAFHKIPFIVANALPSAVTNAIEAA